MLELMRFYIFHKNGFRVAFSMNSAAGNIWTAWLCSFMFISGGLVRLVAEGITDRDSYLMFILGAVIYLSSYYFLSKAKRIHEIRRASRNAVLFSE